MPDTAPSNVATVVPGLDDIVAGGLPRGRLYLVEGDPGTGKTTLALQLDIGLPGMDGYEVARRVAAREQRGDF